MGWLNDVVLPVVGGATGYYFGGPWGAAAGATGGSVAGSLFQKKDTDRTVMNALAAGMMGYGAGKGLDYSAQSYFGDTNFGAPPDRYPISEAEWESLYGSGGARGTGAGGGIFGKGLTMPATMMGLNAIAQMYGASSAKRNAQNVYDQQLGAWNQTAFPKSSVVDAQTASALSGINQQSMLARQRLFEQMAARGMGGNSGVLAGASAEEDRARRQRLAMLANNMIQFKNTPMFAPPTYPYTASAGEKLADTVGSSAGLLAGMGLYDYMR